MTLHGGFEDLQSHPQYEERNEETANADGDKEHCVHGWVQRNKVIVLPGLVEEAQVYDSDLDNETGCFEFVESIVVEGLFGDLHRQEANKK